MRVPTIYSWEISKFPDETQNTSFCRWHVFSDSLKIELQLRTLTIPLYILSYATLAEAWCQVFMYILSYATLTEAWCQVFSRVSKHTHVMVYNVMAYIQWLAVMRIDKKHILFLHSHFHCLVHCEFNIVEPRFYSSTSSQSPAEIENLGPRMKQTKWIGRMRCKLKNTESRRKVTISLFRSKSWIRIALEDKPHQKPMQLSQSDLPLEEIDGPRRNRFIQWTILRIINTCGLNSKRISNLHERLHSP